MFRSLATSAEGGGLPAVPSEVGKRADRAVVVDIKRVGRNAFAARMRMVTRKTAFDRNNIVGQYSIFGVLPVGFTATKGTVPVYPEDNVKF